MLFDKGQVVRLLTRAYGITSEEEEKILKVTDHQVWLDNGIGNDPTGPFCEETGHYKGDTFPGFSLRITSKQDPA